jgi:hypothetical protein
MAWWLKVALAPDRLTISRRRLWECFRGETNVGQQLEQNAPPEFELKKFRDGRALQSLGSPVAAKELRAAYRP